MNDLHHLSLMQYRMPRLADPSLNQGLGSAASQQKPISLLKIYRHTTRWFIQLNLSIKREAISVSVAVCQIRFSEETSPINRLNFLFVPQ